MTTRFSALKIGGWTEQRSWGRHECGFSRMVSVVKSVHLIISFNWITRVKKKPTKTTQYARFLFIWSVLKAHSLASQILVVTYLQWNYQFRCSYSVPNPLSLLITCKFGPLNVLISNLSLGGHQTDFRWKQMRKNVALGSLINFKIGIHRHTHRQTSDGVWGAEKSCDTLSNDSIVMLLFLRHTLPLWSAIH